VCSKLPTTIVAIESKIILGQLNRIELFRNIKIDSLFINGKLLNKT
jgi:hypothetical protein